MCSIRNLTATVAIGLLCLGVGCVKKQPAPAAAASNTLAADDATALRGWSQSTAKFEATSVPAGPDRFPFEPSNPDNGVYLDTPLFLVNTVVLPFTYFNQTPGTSVNNSTGASVASGYSAIPQGGGAAGTGNGVMTDYSGRSVPSRIGSPNAQGSIGGRGATGK